MFGHENALYAYLQSKVYGDRPGEIYHERGVQLWMPRKLVELNQTEVNYIAGYGNNSLYLVLTNQSRDPLQVHLRLDPNIVSLKTSQNYRVRVWQDNHPRAPSQLVNAQLSVPISSEGLTVLAIDGLKVVPRWQARYFDPRAKPLSDQSFSTVGSPFGAVHGMLFSMGRSFDSAYVWLEATEKDLREARLSYKSGNEWKQIVDTHYPYEFSLPRNEKDADFEFYVEGVKSDGDVVRSDQIHLHR